MARVSLPAFLAEQLNGGMLGEELEGECLDVADLWVEQDQRSAALLEQVCGTEQSAHGRRGEELHPGQVHCRCAGGHGRAHHHVEPIHVAGFDLAPYQQPVGDDGGLPKVSTTSRQCSRRTSCRTPPPSRTG